MNVNVAIDAIVRQTTLPIGRRLGRASITALLLVACGNTVRRPQQDQGQAGSPVQTGGVSHAGGSARAGSAAGGNLAGQGGNQARGGLAGAADAAGAADEGGAGPGLVPISGRVVTFDEYPIAGAVVEVAGKRLITDAQGRFQTEAELPYDIVVHHPENVGEGQVAGLPPNSSDAYLDVTRQEVKLYSRAKIDRWCGLSGTITGAASPTAGLRRTDVTVVGAPLRRNADDYELSADNRFSVEQAAGESSQVKYLVDDWLGRPMWGGAATMTGLLFAVQYDPNSLVGVGWTRLTFVHGTVVGSPSADLVLAAPKYRDFRIDVTAPARATLYVGTDGISDLFQSAAQLGEFHHVVQALAGVPDEVGTTLTVGGLIDGKQFAASRWVPSSASGVEMELALEAAPSIQSPGEVVYDQPTSTVFRFTPATNAMTAIRFCDAPSEQAAGVFCATVFTNDSSLPLPRLLDLGLEGAVPIDQLIRWRVVSRLEANSVDAFLAPDRVARDFQSEVSAATGPDFKDRIFYRK